VIAGIAEVFATIESPGVISHGLLGRLRFGEMDGKESERARDFLAACGRASIPAELAGDPLRMLWEKYVFLVAQSGMTALTRCTAGVLRALPETRAMYRRLFEELVRLGRAAGAAIDDTLTDALLGRLDTLGAGAFSSLHFDLAHGKRLELEALQGHAVRLGERHGIPTPALSALYAALCPFRDGRPREALG
jgi:2-dehydropantoate 2-reductase